MKMKATIQKASVAVLSAMMLLSSCGGKKQQAGIQATFPSEKATAKDVTLQNKYSATIRGRQDIDVYPQVAGTLQKLCVTEGQRVTKGQPLFIIDQVPYQAALNTAEAALKAAQAQEASAALNYESKKTLRKENVISDFDLQTTYNTLLTAKAQVAQAEAQVVNARNSLSYTVVKSPADGVVGTLPYRQGALVSSAMPKPLTTVSDNHQMYVYFSMSEADLLSMCREHSNVAEAIEQFPELTLQLVDGAEYAHKGKVESVSGVIDLQTGSVQLRALFENPEGLLHSGSTGVVCMPVTLKDQIVIPIQATVQMQDKYKVWLVGSDSCAHEQIVKLHPHNGGKEVIVLEGLKLGQEYVSEGAGMVKNGQKVK